MTKKKRFSFLKKDNLVAVSHAGYLKLEHRKIDGRTSLGIVLNKIKKQMITDLGGDPTMAQELLIDRVRFKALRLNYWEQALSFSGNQDFEHYIKMSNSFRSDLMALGLERKEKNYITLQDYLQQKTAEKEHKP